MGNTIKETSSNVKDPEVKETPAKVEAIKETSSNVKDPEVKETPAKVEAIKEAPAKVEATKETPVKEKVAKVKKKAVVKVKKNLELTYRKVKVVSEKRDGDIITLILASGETHRFSIHSDEYLKGYKQENSNL